MAITDPFERIELNDGNKMPLIGIGTFRMSPIEAKHSVLDALKVGYRLIDTASSYQNEKGIWKAIRESGLGREELFITSKVWNTQQGFEGTVKALEGSLADLGTDYLDLYLIHWPIEGKTSDTWKAMEAIRDEGLSISIGVSNFKEHHLKELSERSEVIPAVDQVETHLYLAQFELHRHLVEKGIRGEAWSPLMKGKVGTIEEVRRMAEKYSKTPSQIALRWLLQRGIVVIPKTIRPERIAENFDIFDFEIAGSDISTLDRMDRGYRVGPDPDNADF